MRPRVLSACLTATATAAMAVAVLLDAPRLVPWGVTVVALLVVAAMVTWRVPSSSVGWLLMFGAWTTSVAQPLVVLAWRADDPGAAGLLSAIAYTLVSVGIMVLPVILLRFPDGRLLTPRWRPVEWTALAAAATGGVAALIHGGFGGDRDQVPGRPPFREAAGSLGDVLSSIFYPLLAASMILAAVSLVLRFRRSTGEERLQIKWLAYAAGFLAVTIFLMTSAGVWSGAAAEGWQQALVAVAFAGIPAAIGVAVLKYRLYDVDVVISRTLVYGSLAVLIGGLYVGIVIGLGRLLGLHDEEGGPNTLLGLAALVVIPIVFQPARRRLERWANRVVYGRRVTPYEVLSNFSQRVAAVDPEVLMQVARSLAEGTTAGAAAIWAGDGQDETLIAAWPEGMGALPVERMTAVPIVHDGEALGRVTLSPPPGQALLPTDERLLAQVASGLGLALRNRSLTSDLQVRVEQLRESRRRIVAVQDGTRRQLERNLHDGAQQRLVALKVKLGLATAMAEKEGLGEVGEMLAGLRDQTDVVIDTVREFARGVYPPLLEAEGLPAALAANLRQSPVPVSLQASGVGRYPREVEAIVYFCVISAVSAAAARGAGSVQVFVDEEAGALVFQVRDDGAQPEPGDLVNLVDRLDAAGGTLDISSRPGHGTFLQGQLPVPQVVTA